MAQVRPSKEILERKLLRQQNIKRNIKIAEAVAAGIETPFWKALKDMFLSRLRYIDGELDAFVERTHDQRALLLSERKVLRAILAIENHGLETLKDLLEKTASDVEQYKEQVASYGDGKS